jgi:uncharacterized protein
MTDTPDVQVMDNPSARQFEAQVDGHKAVVEYALEPDCIRFTHTLVPPELAGQGIGGKLAEACLRSARARGLRVKPDCSFIAGYIKKHPEHQDLLHEDYRVNAGP